mgnify:CR=1 FL=1
MRINQLIRLVVLVGLVGLGETGYGQQQDTVYQTVILNTKTVGVTSITRNIGQTFHLVTMIGTSGCTQGVSGLFSLEGSFNNSSWTAIRVAALQPSNTFNSPFWSSFTFTGQGAYPYLRFNLNSINSIGGEDCRIDVYYSGNVTGSTVSSSFPVNQETFIYAYGFAVNTDNPRLQIGTCPANTNTAFYGGVLRNVGGTAIAGSVSLQGLQSSGPSVYSSMYEVVNMQANENIVLPQGPRPYGVSSVLTTTIARPIFIAVPAVGAFNLYYNLVFRCE